MKGSLISGTATVAIVIASTIIVVNVISPMMEETDVSQTIGLLKQELTVIDSTVKEVSAEAPGSSRQIVVDSKTSDFVVSGLEDKIMFRLENVETSEPGVSAKEGDIVVSGGGTTDAYEKDVNSDGVTDLVLENDALLFAVKKVTAGSINMTNMVTIIKNKKTGTEFQPVSRIILDSRTNTSYGTGFSELVSAGDFLSSGSIRVHVISSGGYTYDAVFSLSGIADFVELQIKNVVKD